MAMERSRSESTAITAIITAFQAPLLRYAARILNNATLAQDVVQNALIKLARKKPPPTEPNDEIRNWLFKVTHNEAIDLIRHEERKRQLHTRYAEQRELLNATAAHNSAVASEQHQLVMLALQKLTPQQRQVVLLRLQQGLDYQSIAAITGIKPGYVGNLLHHAVKTLSVEVKKYKSGDNHV